MTDSNKKEHVNKVYIPHGKENKGSTWPVFLSFDYGLVTIINQKTGLFQEPSPKMCAIPGRYRRSTRCQASSSVLPSLEEGRYGMS